MIITLVLFGHLLELSVSSASTNVVAEVPPAAREAVVRKLRERGRRVAMARRTG